MDDCEKIIENIPLYVEDELRQEDRKSFERHMEQCENCQLELRQYNQMMNLLNGMSTDIFPDDLHEITMNKVKVISEPIELFTKEKLKNRLIEQHSKMRNIQYKNWTTMVSAALVIFVLFGGGLSVVSGVLESNQVGNNTASDALPQLAMEQPVEPNVMNRSFKMEESISMPANEMQSDMVTNVEVKPNLSRNLFIQIEVDNFQQSIDGIHAMGGMIQFEEVSFDEGIGNTVNITKSVSIEQFSTIKNDLFQLGNIIHSEENTQDVSALMWGLDTNINVKQGEIERLQALMSKSDSLEMLVPISIRLTEVQDEKGQLENERIAVKDSVQNATISIELIEKKDRWKNESFGHQFKTAFLSSSKVCIQFIENMIIWICTFIVPVGLIIGFLLILKRLVNKGKRGKSSDKKE